MSNLIYNELMACGFCIDVWVVETLITKGKRQRYKLEVDFACQRDHARYYIQLGLTVAEESKRLQEISLL